ncbi:IGK protein, partial [Polypterus senegalus]
MQPHQSVRAQLGGSVNLACHMKISSQYSYIWIKYTQGELPETIVFWSNHEDRTLKGNDGSTRYQVMTSLSSFNLSIKHLNASDLGTYYCGVVKPESILFGSGTEICLSGSISKESLPIFKVTEEEHIVTLSCIINQDIYGEEFRVLWFHESLGESSQKITTISGNGTMKRDCGSTECIVKSSLNYLAAGKYYCGVVMCGRVFISNETNWNFTGNDFSSGFDPIVLTLALSNLALLILLLVFAFKSIRGCHRYAEVKVVNMAKCKLSSSEVLQAILDNNSDHDFSSSEEDFSDNDDQQRALLDTVKADASDHGDEWVYPFEATCRFTVDVNNYTAE